MKIRNGFVSNSSSSSFIVIGEQDKVWLPVIHEAYRIFGTENILNIPQTFGGEYEFGWEQVERTSFADRLNWAALCAWYKEGQPGYIPEYYEGLQCSTSWTEMLVKILKEDFNVDKVYINFIDSDADEQENSDKVYGYIDHQSAPYETPANAAMFESEEKLRLWLYANDSKIVGGNDNWDPSDESSDEYNENNEDADYLNNIAEQGDEPA